MKQRARILRYIYTLSLLLLCSISQGQIIRTQNIERAKAHVDSSLLEKAYPRTDSFGIQRYVLDTLIYANDTLYWNYINQRTGDTLLNQKVKIVGGGGDSLSPLSVLVAKFNTNIAASSTFSSIVWDSQILSQGTEIYHDPTGAALAADRIRFERNGIFMVTVKAYWDGVGSNGADIRVQLNGVTIGQSTAVSKGGGTHGFLSFYVDADSSQYIQVQLAATANTDNWAAGETTVSVQSVAGVQGPAGGTGAAGATGAAGVGIDTAYITADTLYVVTTAGDTINTGYVKGPIGATGATGAAGADGIDVVNVYIATDSLYVVLSNMDTINAGHLREGLDGVGVDTAYITGDSLYIVLTDATIINAGYLAAGTGTVTSVGLSMPGQFSVSGSPVTTAGTLTAAWNTQTANTHLSGPETGGAAVPTFRTLVENDIPSHTYTKITNITSPRLLGRTTGGTGAAELITAGTGLTLSGGVLAATNNGTVTSVGISSTDLSVSGSPITGAGTITLNINDLAVTNAKLATNSVSTGKIQANAVTLDKLVTVFSPSLLGRSTGGVGNVEQISIGSGLTMSGGTLSASGSSNWTLASGTLYPVSTATDVVIGGTALAATGLKFQVTGKAYVTSDAFVGAALDLTAANRGFMNVRMYEGGYGGYAQHTGSGSTHGVTTLQNSSIWSRWYSTSGQTILSGIGNTANISPVVIQGIHNNTAIQVGAIELRVQKRSGTNVTAIADDEQAWVVTNNNSGLLTQLGNGRLQVVSTSGIVVPIGTTAQRETQQGLVRYNTSTGKFEGYTGSAWVDLH